VDQPTCFVLVPPCRRLGNPQSPHQSVKFLIAGTEVVAHWLAFNVRLYAPVERLQAARPHEPTPSHHSLPALGTTTDHDHVRRFHGEAPSLRCPATNAPGRTEIESRPTGAVGGTETSRRSCRRRPCQPTRFDGLLHPSRCRATRLPNGHKR